MAFPQESIESMTPGTAKALTSAGWLFLFLFLAISTAQCITDLWSVGSLLGLAFFGTMFAFWIRLGWQTLRKWELTIPSTIATMMLLGGVFSFLTYLMWLGKR
jgi:hypothetical protein